MLSLSFVFCFFLMMRRLPRSTLFPYTTLFRSDRVSVDSHFFDELGADSLVMAHFCARVRKRGNLPSVSMKDVYAHPTDRKSTRLNSVTPISRMPSSA